MTKIFDCFMFYNEFDHLRIRLRELWDVVDTFILVEGNLTHTGNHKPLYFQERQEEFKEFSSKLISKVVELPAFGKEPWFGWGREILQRSAINGYLGEMLCNADDIIITGDVDEIPRVRAIEEYRDRPDICCLEEKNYHYNLSTRLKTPTLDPKICRYWHVRNYGVSDLRYCHQAATIQVIRDAGWHLSFMGGTEKIIEKMKAYAHYDIREPRMGEFVSLENVEASIRDRRSLFQKPDLRYLSVNELSDMPKYIRENHGHFVESGWIVETPVVVQSAKKVAISVIIPTFNREDLIRENLDSMRQVTDLSDMEVIIVSNGCKDGTQDYVKSLGEPFRLLSFPEALGYPKATNEGIKVATGDHLILLNNDILFQGQPRHQWVEQLMAPFKGNPKMGITGPLQFHDYYSETDMVVGACLCISRVALQAAGGLLDEVFSPGGGEDVDLCCKVRNAGFIVRQIPLEGKPGCQWANVDGMFMLYHKNNQTFKDIPEYWGKIVKRNGLINLKRYNKEIRLNLFGESRWGYVSCGDLEDLRAYVPLDPAKLDLADGSVAELLAVRPGDRLHFKEWRRVLRPEGRLILELPATNAAAITALLLDDGFVQVICGVGIYERASLRVEAMKPKESR